MMDRRQHQALVHTTALPAPGTAIRMAEWEHPEAGMNCRPGLLVGSASVHSYPMPLGVSRRRRCARLGLRLAGRTRNPCAARRPFLIPTGRQEPVCNRIRHAPCARAVTTHLCRAASHTTNHRVCRGYAIAPSAGPHLLDRGAILVASCGCHPYASRCARPVEVIGRTERSRK